MNNGVGIYGGFPNTGDPDMADRDPNLYETILSGNIGTADDPDDNCYHVFYHPAELSLDPNAMLDGFTITAGNADGSGDHRRGGGMYNYESSPTVTNCTFTGNSAKYDGGGGMYNDRSSPIVTNCTIISNYRGGMRNYSSSPTVTNCTFTGNTGGGMHNYSSSPTVTNCTFTGNSAPWGGGMYNSGSSPTVTNCTFTGNRTSGAGSGMCNVYSSPTVSNCTFTENSAGTRGGGMLNEYDSNPMVTDCTFTGNRAEGEYSSGGGMQNGGEYPFGCSPTVTNCTFINNSANEGGGMTNVYRSSPTVTNCTFTGNSADHGGGGLINVMLGNPTVTGCTITGNSADGGGGMVNWSSSPTVTNCTFGGNLAYNGGGMFNEHSNTTVINCTFTGNSADWLGGGMYNWSSSPTLTNCILWGNSASYSGNEIYNEYSNRPVISYCNISGCGASGAGWDTDLGEDGGGNIDADPCFVDIGYWDPNNTPDNPNDDFWVNGDYHLLTGSPCIDAGDNSVVDANIPDLDGNPRIMNDVVDMGAYEFLPPIQVDVHIIPRIINRNNRLKRIIAIVRLPEGINKSDVSDEPFVLYVAGDEIDGIEATWQRVIGRPGRVSVFAFFDKAELMDLVSRNGPAELTVTGKLESGRCISGSDTIRINQPTRRRPRLRRR
jgi:parallel beta-helix repeat protein